MTYLADRGADHTGKGGVGAGQIVPDDPALLVGVRAERHVLVLAGDQVEDLHAVTTRPDAVVAEDPHLQVRAQAAVITQRQAGLAGERGVRPYAETEDDHVGWDGAVGGQHRADSAVAAGLESDDDGVGVHIDTYALHSPVHRRAHVRVEGGHGLRGPVDDGDRDTASHECLGHLDADVAPADHDGPAGPRAIEVGQERGAVVERLYPEHTGRVHAGQRWSHRDRAGRDDQGVETFTVRPPGSQVVSCHPPGREVDLLYLGSHAKVDAIALVLFGRTRDQALPLVDVTGHPVRDATGRVGTVRSALERDDLDRFPRDPLGLRGRAHPGRVRPDDDYALGHR